MCFGMHAPFAVTVAWTNFLTSFLFRSSHISSASHIQVFRISSPVMHDDGEDEKSELLKTETDIYKGAANPVYFVINSKAHSFPWLCISAIWYWDHHSYKPPVRWSIRPTNWSLFLEISRGNCTLYHSTTPDGFKIFVISEEEMCSEPPGVRICTRVMKQRD